jgi:hypothetical protein
VSLFKPFEQIISELATTAAIKIGAKSNTDLAARAGAALAVGSVFKTASTGDISTAALQLQALLTNPNMDPGIAKVVTDLANLGDAFLQAESAALQATPVVGQGLDAIFGNIAAGMTSTASTYIAKYGSSTSSSTSSSTATAASTPAASTSATGATAT